MPSYAVKIGIVTIRAERPITSEDRGRVAAQLRKRGNAPLLTVDDLEVELVVVSEQR